MSTNKNIADCIFYKQGKCGVYSRQKGRIHENLVTLSMLNESIIQHSRNIGVNLSEYTERSLIMSRIGVPDVCKDDDVKCPYHRYSYGIMWRPSKLCQSPYHNDKKPMATHALPVDYYAKLVELEFFKGNKMYQFPVGQKVCRTCLTKITFSCINKTNITMVKEDPSLTTRSSKMKAQEQIHDLINNSTEFQSPSQFSDCSSIYTEKLSLNHVNQILMAISNKIELLKYQIQQPIHDLSAETIRSVKRHYGSIIKEFSAFICEGIAPGQGQHLLEVFEEKLDSTTQSIVEAYHSAPSRKWKYFLLSTVSKQFTNDTLQSMFNCNRYMIDKSRYILQQNNQFNSMNKNIIRRTRLERNRLELFFDFLFSSGLIQDVAHGTTFLRFDRGEKILVPYVVRVMMKNHIFQLYHQHCNQTCSAQPLSRSTVYRLLDVCKMQQKKTMCGLDSFVVDGNNGFDMLENIVKDLELNKNEEKNMLQLVSLSRNYLKFEYSQNVNDNKTNCATHCRLFALSHPTDKNFKASCGHTEHSMTCIKCNTLLRLLCRMQSLVYDAPSSSRKDDMISDLSTAQTDIMGWMFHIIRGVQQDKSKKSVMSQLNSNTGILLPDWAMKILPQSHREKMDDWFGEKGISLHVDALFYMDTNNNLKKNTYFTVIDRCLQDMSSVLCVFEHVLDQIKADIPKLTNLYTRSDNAGCYSGTAIVLARRMICESVDIQLRRTDFSEPQRGKDQADRDIAVAKSCLKSYTNRGGNLLNAESVKQALDESFGSLPNCKTSVIAVEESKCLLPKMKIEGITKYHSISFDKNSITFWQYFDIGIGKSKKWTNCGCTFYTTVIQPFTNTEITKREFYMSSTLSSTVFFCSNDSCLASFDNEQQLIEHEQNGEHLYNEESSLSTMDRGRYLYIDHLKGARLLEEASNKTAIQSLQNSNTGVNDKHDNDLFPHIFLSPGYGIRRRQKTTKMTTEQQDFFKKLFYRGNDTGKKVSIEKAYEEMRGALKPDNTKLFHSDQYLTKNQIRSLFGRLTKRETTERRNKLVNPEDNNLCTSDEEDLAEDYFKIQQQQEWEDIKSDEIDNALNCCSDDELDMDGMINSEY